MRVRRFHEEQIVRLLREQELSGQTVASFIRRNGISRHTFYRWRKKYGGLTETEAIRLKRLEQGAEMGRMISPDPVTGPARQFALAAGSYVSRFRGGGSRNFR